MKENDRKPYETPAVVFERELEVLAGYCGEFTNDTYLGGDNCKASPDCATTLS